MIRIFDIAWKDLMQILRDRKTFLFLLIMPIAFTLLFGFAFGGSGKTTDPRLPVGYLDQDGGGVERRPERAAGELNCHPPGRGHPAQHQRP